jgi:hypothetical protein
MSETQTIGEGDVAAPPAEQKKQPAALTKYHVLKRVIVPAGSPSQVEETWALVGRSVEALSGEAAKRRIAATLTTTGDESVELVAVPTRSWQPQTATVQVQTTLVLK